ncbi:MAG: hypothetical protein IJI45_11210 [Anaerolineaceae bacterium]|nr:hypothetical protein [Anaerolineaceae bacterium]
MIRLHGYKATELIFLSITTTNYGMLDVFTVSFFGHRVINNYREAKQRVAELVRSLIREHEYVEFLVGRDGDFDQIVSSEVRRAKEEVFSANSSLVWVLPYEKAEYKQNQVSFDAYYDEVEVCPESESEYPKAAIQIRNRSMVDRSDLVVFFVSRHSGGAYQTMQYALRVGKQIQNLAI